MIILFEILSHIHVKVLEALSAVKYNQKVIFVDLCTFHLAFRMGKYWMFFLGSAVLLCLFVTLDLIYAFKSDKRELCECNICLMIEL